jgi:hypothetical protein
MLTLYLDHSVVSHEPSWQPIEEILSSGKLRLVLSLWNLVEIGSAADTAQRERRLSFLEKFNPLWIVERVPVQRQEVEYFLRKEFFRVDAAQPQVFAPHLSMVDHYHAGPLTRIGLTARRWIDGVNFKRLDESKQLAPNALKILQAVGKKTFKARQREIFRPRIKALIPKSDPDGKLLTRAQRLELLDYCEQHQKQFFAACKSLNVEDALTAARVAVPDRKPQRSDGIDLMHAVIALAYCDFFLVRDGFVRACAADATKVLAPIKVASVYNDAATLRKQMVL